MRQKHSTTVLGACIVVISTVLWLKLKRILVGRGDGRRRYSNTNVHDTLTTFIVFDDPR